MRKIARSEWVNIKGAELRVNANEKQGIYLEIMEAAKGQLDAMLESFGRVLVLRIDIRQHDYTGNNEPISRFMRKLIKKLKKRYKTTKIGFLWVREMEKVKHQHYHLVLMLDGRKVQHPSAIIKLIEGIAEDWDWPKPYTPRNCFYMLKKANTETYQDALFRISYLAKERGKGYKDLTANNYGRSNIK